LVEHWQGRTIAVTHQRTVTQIGSRSVGEKTEAESLPVTVPRSGSKGRSIQVPKLTLCGSRAGAAMTAPTTVCIDSSAAVAIKIFRWHLTTSGIFWK
jgi:hypothetical protein